MSTQYENMAVKAYANDSEEKKRKAIASGKAIDNALKLEYGKGGGTKSHFMIDNWMAYFSYEAMGPERIRLMYAINNK